MTKDQALEYLKSRARHLTWRELADEIGEPAMTVFGWVRRGSVPRWRIPAIKAAADKHNKRRQAA